MKNSTYTKERERERERLSEKTVDNFQEITPELGLWPPDAHVCTGTPMCTYVQYTQMTWKQRCYLRNTPMSAQAPDESENYNNN